MKTVRAKEHDDEPVTQAVFARAVDLGSQRRNTTPHAKGVRYLPEFEALAVSFKDKTAVLLPVKNYAELARLSLAELHRIEVGFGGSALCLVERDLNVSIAGLVIASKPLMELAVAVMSVSEIVGGNARGAMRTTGLTE